MSFLCEPASLSDTLKKIKDNKEAAIASAFAGTGIPILDSILTDLSAALNSLSTEAVSAAAANVASKAESALTRNLGKNLGPMAASALGGLTTILNISAEAQLVGMAVLVNNLKRQAYQRLILNKEAQFHVQGIRSILGQLNQRSNDQKDPRLRAAYPYIQTAYKKLVRLRENLKEPKPRFNLQLFRTVLINIDIAIYILTGNRNNSLAKKFIADIKLKADKDGVHSNITARKFGNYIYESVLAKYVMMAEIYMFHLTNLAALMIPGYTSTGFGLADLSNNGRVPGLDENRHAELRRRQQLLQDEKAKWAATSPKLNGPMRTLAWVDANKGLAITHETAKISAKQIAAFKADWSKVETSAKTLWVLLTPSEEILSDVNTRVGEYLNSNVTATDTVKGAVSAIGEPIILSAWTVAELTAARELLATMERSGKNFDNVAEDLQAWDDIVTYLESDPYFAGIDAEDTVLKLAVTAAAFSITGPFNKRILRRAIVLFNEIDLLLSKSISQDTILLQKLNNFNIMNNPIVAKVAQALADLGAQNPVAAGLVNSLVNGDAALVATLIVSTIDAAAAGLGALQDMYKKFSKGCDTPPRRGVRTNALADINNRVQEDRVRRDAASREAAADVPASEELSDYFYELAL